MKSMRHTIGLAVNVGGFGLMLYQLSTLLH
jgi:hypothetical protein